MKDLAPGQLIICEEAGILGPASPDSCLECFDLTKDFCTHCGFNLCHQCQSYQEYLFRHDAEECLALQKIKKPNDQQVFDISGLFNLVFPLRLLRTKLKNPKLYQQLNRLEGHVDLRMDQVSDFFYYKI